MVTMRQAAGVIESSSMMTGKCDAGQREQRDVSGFGVVGKGWMKVMEVGGRREEERLLGF